MIRALMVASTIVCVSQAFADDRTVQSYPEAATYSDCVMGKAATYADQPGSPIDLAITAYGACRPARDALEKALRNDHRDAFVRTFMRSNKLTMIEVAAEIIAERRK